MKYPDCLRLSNIITERMAVFIRSLKKFKKEFSSEELHDYFFFETSSSYLYSIWSSWWTKLNKWISLYSSSSNLVKSSSTPYFGSVLINNGDLLLSQYLQKIYEKTREINVYSCNADRFFNNSWNQNIFRIKWITKSRAFWPRPSKPKKYIRNVQLTHQIYIFKSKILLNHVNS